MVMIIKQAQKLRQNARVCLWGIEKAGKTHAALELATSLVGAGGKIGVISSERGSSSLLAWKFPHDIIDLTVDEGNNPIRNPFAPKRYEEALQTFVQAGYQAIIVDSLSHLWEGEGGMLEIVGSQSGDTFTSGWGKGTPIYQHFLNTLLGVPCHLIVTLRAKEAYVMEEYTKRNGDRGTAPKNVGSAPIIRKGFGFEMQVTIRVDAKVGTIQSSANEEELPKGMEIESISDDLTPILLRWLDGAPPPERVPTLSEIFMVGIQKKSWTKENFYASASAILDGIPVSRDAQLSPEQLKSLMEAAEQGSFALSA
jgi:hypothetical protein